MKHYSIEDWMDFARKIDNGQMAAMQQHLGEGCMKCSKTLELWRNAVIITNRETRFEPPAWAVRAVQASFALKKILPFPSGKIEMAKLFFDSSLQPIVAGVRGSAPTARQLLYKSGSVCIDMRMQPTPGSISMVLLGQLLDSTKPDHGIGGVPVSLLSAGDTISSKRTNYVGEFDFGVAALQQMQLVFGMADSRTIVVPVPDAIDSMKIM
jgi:hypothetical protein